MQFITNDQNFPNILNQFIINAKEISMEIAFVRQSGFNLLKSSFKKFFSNGGKLKLLAGEDFHLTEPQALGSFLKLGAQIKVYKTLGFTYHPKSWIFFLNDGSYIVIIGSSNLSKNALTNNIEINVSFSGQSQDSIIKGSLDYFNSLWNNPLTIKVNNSYIRNYAKIRQVHRIIISPMRKAINTNIKPNKIIKKFLDFWINIPQGITLLDYLGNKKLENWRGWYILPNQGLISRIMLNRLKCILNVILNDSNYSPAGLNIPSGIRGDSIVKNINKKCKIIFRRKKLKTSPRGLFIRQAKNYLEKLGFIESRRTYLKVTLLGKKFAASNYNKMLEIFTDVISSYRWHDLKMLLFLSKLILLLPDKKITYHELNLFVIHAQEREDLDLIKDLIIRFRTLNQNEKDILIKYTHKKIDSKRGTRQQSNMNYEHKTKMLLSIFSNISFLDKDPSNNLFIKNKSKLNSFLETEN